MIKKEIAEKLFKAELSEQQKVELASVQILEGLYQDARKAIDDIKADAKKMSNIASSANRTVAKLPNKIEKQIDDLLRTAKDLGLTESDFPVVKMLRQKIEDLNYFQNALARIAVNITSEIRV